MPKTKIIIFHTCQHCGNQFKHKKDSTNKFCGWSCYKQSIQKSERECEQCKNKFVYNEKEQRFCSQSCSATFKNKNRNPEIYEKVGKKNREHMKKQFIRVKKENIKQEKHKCKFCGTCFGVKLEIRKCQCLGHRKQASIPALHKYFNLSTDNFGTRYFEQDIIQCIENIEELYSENSLISLTQLVNYPDPGNLRYLLLNLGVKTNNLSEAQKKSIKQGRATIPTGDKKYKQGYITLNNKTYFYRSSYELEFAQTLADKNIDFDMESITVEYYDSQEETNRLAFPDFVFEKEKIIAEVKSTWTYDEQNMKDRFEAFAELGYTNYLWLDKEFYILRHDNFIKITDEDFYENFNTTEN